MKKWKCLKSKTVFDSSHMKLTNDLVELPNGERKEWIYWNSIDSAMIVGMTEDKNLIMIRQYRYLVGDEIIEFPSGSLHESENQKAGARREFEEETGYKCKQLIKLGSVYETYGQLNRQIHIYFAPKVNKTKQNLDKGKRGYEDIKVELIPFEKAVELVAANKIAAMGSSLAILLLKEKIDRREIRI